MHLGGDKNINWIIEIDQGLRGEATGKMETILATGRDMYLHSTSDYAYPDCNLDSCVTPGSNEQILGL